MGSKEIIDMLIEGGNAKPGPTTAPKLGMFRVNMKKLFDEINAETQDYKGMSVPVKVFVDKKDGSYTFKIGTPPVSSLLAKELGMKKIAPEKEKEEVEEKPMLKKGKKKAQEEDTEEGAEEEEGKKKGKMTKKIKQKIAKEKEKEKEERKIVADVKIKQIIKVAKMKRSGMLSKTFKAAVKEVVGSCVSMPVTVEGKSPKDVLVDIDEGKYDDVIKE